MNSLLFFSQLKKIMNTRLSCFLKFFFLIIIFFPLINKSVFLPTPIPAKEAVFTIKPPLPPFLSHEKIQKKGKYCFDR